MRNAGGDARLAHEPQARALIRGVVAKDLQRDVAPEPLVLREVDDAHAALAEAAANPVVINPRRQFAVPLDSLAFSSLARGKLGGRFFVLRAAAPPEQIHRERVYYPATVDRVPPAFGEAGLSSGASGPDICQRTK